MSQKEYFSYLDALAMAFKSGIMKQMRFLLCIALLFGCAGGKPKYELSQKEMDQLKLKQLREIRPLLNSDDFPFMQCEAVGEGKVVKEQMPDREFWEQFGLFELRGEGLELGANIMRLKAMQLDGAHHFLAEFFRCERIQQLSPVEGVGMCKPSEQRLFRVKNNLEESRKVGQEIVKQKVRYYGLKKYYKTFSLADFQYSFTKKELEAQAKFFECF